MKNIALQSLQNLYIFVLRVNKHTTFEPKLAGKWWAFPYVIQIYTKFAKLARLYFPYLTTFRNQTLQFYSFNDALSSCLRLSCQSQSLVYNGNCPLNTTNTFQIQICRKNTKETKVVHFVFFSHKKFINLKKIFACKMLNFEIVLKISKLFTPTGDFQ